MMKLTLTCLSRLPFAFRPLFGTKIHITTVCFMEKRMQRLGHAIVKTGWVLVRMTFPAGSYGAM